MRALGIAVSLCLASIAAQAAAVIVVSSLPKGMVQPIGGRGATDAFSLTNIGDATATVAIQATANASFFGYTPAALTLAPGATGMIAIEAFPQSTAGLLKGTLTIPAANETLEVKLLTTPAPLAAVSITPPLVRSEFRVVPSSISPPPCAPTGGCVQFTNNSSVAVDALVTTDADWVHLLQDTVTLQAGETKSVCFDACVQGQTNAKISLAYLNGPQAKQATASVPAVIFSQPTLNSGAPPPLQPGELALFIPSLANRASAIGDLIIGAKSGTLPSNLQIYLQNGGQAAASFSLAPADSLALMMPGVLKNFFASSATAGALQIRGGDVSKVAVVATQINPSSAHSHRAIVPVLRSDRGIAPGQTLVLSGTTKQTDVYVQEMSGNAGAFRLDALDAAGSVLSSRQDSLAPFGVVTIPDAAPDRAVSLRITNTSSAAAVIGAYALAGNPSTGALAAITDPALDSNDERVIVPLVDLGTGSQRSVFTSNRLPTVTTEDFEVHSVLRRRATISGERNAPVPNPIFPTLAAFGTTEYRIVSTSTGYATIDALPGNISSSGRTTRTESGELFATRLPVMPVSSAIGAGDLKRFDGIEDTSAFATDLILRETAAQPATVRVTLRYSFVASSVVSANAVSSKQYSLQPADYFRIRDVTADVIGSARQAFGDLHNVALDIEVIGGSGRVLPLLESVDAANGDVLLRAD